MLVRTLLASGGVVICETWALSKVLQLSHFPSDTEIGTALMVLAQLMNTGFIIYCHIPCKNIITITLDYISFSLLPINKQMLPQSIPSIPMQQNEYGIHIGLLNSFKPL